MITLERAKQLKFRQVLVNQDGKRWSVNGAPKTWKRSPDRIRVPVKHGLYAYGYVTENDLPFMTVEGEEQP